MDGSQINSKPELDAALAKWRESREPTIKAREAAVKKIAAAMPEAYFDVAYREKWAKAAVTVEILDGTLAKFYRRITKRIMILTAGLGDELMEGMFVLRERIRAIEKALEVQKANAPTLADSYKGIWQPGPYERGAVCTNRGALWLCVRATSGKPGAGGSDESGWQLIVKAGKDGRDADTRNSEAA